MKDIPFCKGCGSKLSVDGVCNSKGTEAWMEISIDIIVLCDGCGKELDATEGADHKGRPVLNIVPCDVCVSKERDEAYNEGHKDGVEEGREEEGGSAKAE